MNRKLAPLTGLIALALVALPGAATARMLHVPDEYPTIQAAIDAANRFDEVVVAPGVYEEYGIDFQGKQITVRGTDPGDPEVVAATVVDALGKGRLFKFDSGEGRGSILAGLTLTGGDAIRGGAVLILNASPTIDRCALVANRGQLGGGLSCEGKKSQPLITGTSIRDNDADNTAPGRAVEVFSPELARLLASRLARAPDGLNTAIGGGIRSEECALEIVDSTLSGNTAGMGGGIALHLSPAIVRRSTLTGNHAVWGGGLQLRDASGASLSDLVVSGNSADFGGGGIGVERSDVTIERTEVAANSTSGFGGGLALSRSAPTLANVLAHGNLADGDGGGLAVLNAARPTLLHVTLANNGALRGGGLFVGSDGIVEITNSILWGDSPQEIFDLEGAETVTYSDVQGGWPGDGNIDADPLFVDPSADFHLSAGSPAIDTALADAALPDDIDGDVRPGGSAWDMGADEFFGPPRTLRVPDDYATIQAAIDAAFNGDVVEVAPGSYLEHTIRYRGKAVTVRSENPADPGVVAATVVDAGSLGSVFVFDGGETPASVLAGLTITGGVASDGGGIYATAASPTIDRCVVRDNRASRGNGGGIFANGGEPHIVGATVSGNSAFRCSDPELLCGAGAGLYAAGGARVEGSLFSDNSAEGPGGGVYLEGGTIDGGAISGNAASQGGGLYGQGITVAGQIHVGPGNAAEAEGGGVYCRACDVRDLAVDGNSAAKGGGIALVQSTLRDATVVDNRATQEAGGVWLGEIFRTLVQGNSSDADGGGIANATVVVESTILDNRATARGGGLINAQIIEFCEVRGNEAGTGGGLYSKNGQADEALVSSSLITGNRADRGGGVAIKAPWPPPGWADLLPVKLLDSEVSDNDANEQGGAIYCEECVARVLGSRVTDNRSAGHGGAIWMTPTTSPKAKPKLELEGAWVGRNAAQLDGGAVNCGSGAVVRVTNTEIWSNTAVNGAAFFSDSCDLDLLNSTVTLNQAVGNGGALVTSTQASPRIVPRVDNTILWGNVPNEIVVLSRGLPRVRYSDVAGGWSGPGNFDADPRFVDPDPLEPDLHLTQTSPAIDAGLASVAPPDDIDGERRPEGEKVDVGADELVLADDEAKTPQIDAITPDSGVLLGGEPVVIDGERFGTYSRVYFGSREAEVLTVDPLRLEVMSPAGSQAGAVDVKVTNFGAFSDTVDDGFLYILPAPPEVNAVDPDSGPVEGGNTVTITGSGFRQTPTVFFGQRKGTGVMVLSLTEMTVVVPAADEPSRVDVVVVDGYGQTGVLLQGYAYGLPPQPRVDSVDPTSGPVSGGTVVTITGDQFVTGDEVLFGDVPAKNVVVLSAQQIRALTPPSAVIGPVDVRVRDTFGQEGVLPGGFEYLPEVDPEIFELDPPSGSTAGGQTVLIRGQGFADPMQLFVDGRAVPVTYLDAATLSFVTPSHPAAPGCATSVAGIRVVRSDGLAASSAFTYEPEQVIEVSPGQSIQAAISSAANGACILVHAKSYPGYVENLDFGARVIALYGEFPGQPTRTVINGSGASSAVVRFSGNQGPGTLLAGVALVLGNGGVSVTDSSPRLEDLVIQANEKSGDGGGIYVTGGSSRPRLARSVVAGNYASSQGGGIYLTSGSAIELEDDTLTLNEADEGGGLWLGNNSEVTLTGQTISYNDATSLRGGGIWTGTGVVLELVSSEVVANTAIQYGGGIALGNDSQLTLTDSSIRDNVSYQHGGGIWTGLRCRVTATGGELAGNTAGFSLTPPYGGEGSGGGLFVSEDGEVAITDLQVSANAGLSSISTGGGFYLGPYVTGSIAGSHFLGNLAQKGGALTLDTGTAVVLERNEVACNQAVENGDPEAPDPVPFFAPGIYVVEGQGSFYNNTVVGNFGGDGSTPSGGLHTVSPLLFPEVVNNLFAYNQGYGLYCSPGALLGRIDYNLYFDNTDGDVANCVPGANSVHADPLLVAPACPNPDLHLSPGSPAIDAGDPDFPVPPGGGDRIDIGAHELTP